MKTFFIVLFLLSTIAFSEDPCLNNGVYNQRIMVCSCPEPFIGLNCNTRATKLEENGITATISNNFSYFYMNPPTKKNFLLMFTICLQSEKSDFNLILFGQHQRQNGDFSLFPISTKQAIQIHFRFSSKCFAIQNFIPYFDVKRADGQELKLIFGIMSLDKNQKANSQKISLHYQINNPINTNFFQYLLFALIATLVPCIFIALFQCIDKKRRSRKTKKRKSTELNELMPITKYKQHVQHTITEQTENQKEHCSICLSEYQQKSNIRITPCSHVFHQICLDSWLETHNTCPVCRFSVLEQDSLELDPVSDRRRNSMRLTLF